MSSWFCVRFLRHDRILAKRLVICAYRCGLLLRSSSILAFMSAAVGGCVGALRSIACSVGLSLDVCSVFCANLVSACCAAFMEFSCLSSSLMRLRRRCASASRIADLLRGVTRSSMVALSFVSVFVHVMCPMAMPQANAPIAMQRMVVLFMRRIIPCCGRGENAPLGLCGCVCG